MDRPLPMHRLQSMLSRYGVGWNVSWGKGSHLMFYRDLPDGRFTYPVPTHDKDVKICYVRGCRKRFRLMSADGVSDKEFYG